MTRIDFPRRPLKQLSYPSPCSRRRHSTRETHSALNLLRGRSPLPQTPHFPRLSPWGTLSLPLPSPQAAVWAYVIGAGRIQIPTPYESPISRRETNRLSGATDPQKDRSYRLSFRIRRSPQTSSIVPVKKLPNFDPSANLLASHPKEPLLPYAGAPFPCRPSLRANLPASPSAYLPSLHRLPSRSFMPSLRGHFRR